MQYVVMYVRITDDKKKGIILRGPWYNSAHDTHEEAENDVKELINESKNSAVIAKIFEMEGNGYFKVREMARKYFNRIEREMNESKEMLERPNKK